MTAAEIEARLRRPPTEDGPREYTVEEIREQVFKHLWGIIEYWETVKPTSQVRPETEIRYRLSGLMHSTLAMLDGCTIPLPGFAIVPVPNEDDKAYYQKDNQNWYPREENVKYDIGGGLCGELFRHDPKKKKP